MDSDEELLQEESLEDEETLVDEEVLEDEVVLGDGVLLDDDVLLVLRHSGKVEYAVVHSVLSYRLPNLPITGIVVQETREARHESVLEGVDVVSVGEVVGNVLVLASVELVGVELVMVSWQAVGSTTVRQSVCRLPRSLLQMTLQSIEVV